MRKIDNTHMAKDIPSDPKSANSQTNRVFQSLVYFVSIAEPVATLPQVYTIWIDKKTAGVSLLSWCGYILVGGAWLFYGIS